MKRKRGWQLGLSGLALVGLALSASWFWRRYSWRWQSAGTARSPLAVAEIPLRTDQWDFPLDPAHFGPYIPYQSGPLAVDTRFGAQNPGVGNAGKCFVDRNGIPMPFNQLYHAGEDWFALNEAGMVDGMRGAGAPVHAVANGGVVAVQDLGRDGYAIIIAHTLPDGTRRWSVYWHVAAVEVAVGEAVTATQRIAVVHNRGFNSHLHWEIRTFADGSALFPPDSAGGRGTCNGYVMGVGYTWDDDVARARPEDWGYLNPTAALTALMLASNPPRE